MRNISLFKRSAIAVASLALGLGFCAQAKPKIEKGTAKTKIPIEVGDIKRSDINRTAVGERFRLWFSVNPTDCNDPVLQGNAGKDDHEFDAYGELRVNNTREWNVARQNAINFRIKHLDLPSSTQVDPRKQGYSLNADPTVFQDKHEIKFDTSNGRIARITLRLMDKDDPQTGFDYHPRDQNKVDRRDDLIGDYKIDLDLGKQGKSNGSYYWFWSGQDDNGNAVGTNLYLFVEHVGTTYVSTPNGPPKPQVDPKIGDKKFPGKGPGPGPVIRKSVPATTMPSSR
jgi:hypothetical protein